MRGMKKEAPLKLVTVDFNVLNDKFHTFNSTDLFRFVRPLLAVRRTVSSFSI